jgi:periplasmic protein TonB
MFTNLIESDSHRKEFRRRSSFFLATVAGYAVVLFAASIAGIYAYDARVEAQTTELLVEWLPPIKPPEVRDQPRVTQPTRRNTARSNAPVDPNIQVAERTKTIAATNDPTKIPDDVGIKPSDVPPTIGQVKLSNRNVDPPGLPNTNSGTCTNCAETEPRVAVDTTTPPPLPAVTKPKHVSSVVLSSKIVNLPKPVYPIMAKQIKAQGPVNVQILVDESGKVISAHAINGHMTLTKAAEEAAMRARFTPTLLNEKPIKVQGVITYNFVLQ